MCSVAYAGNSVPEPTSTGDYGAQVVDQDDYYDGPGDDEEQGDSDEPGDVYGPAMLKIERQPRQ